MSNRHPTSIRNDLEVVQRTINRIEGLLAKHPPLAKEIALGKQLADRLHLKAGLERELAGAEQVAAREAARAAAESHEGWNRP